MEDTLVTKKMVDRAADHVRSPEVANGALLEATKTIADWRALHAHPLIVIAMWIRRIAQTVSNDAIVAQRLKRMPSIIGKIRRFPAMKASRMQDIGGLRVILDTIEQVDLVYEKISASRSKHRPVLPPKDYISSPKPDGYRSLHQVFKYIGDKYPQLNGMQIELQLRTRLQHAWATAVEILEIVENAPFKSGGGNEKFRRFFLLASALFAANEARPVPEACAGVPQAELLRELDALDGELHAFARLQALAVSARMSSAAKMRNGDCFILMLRLNGGGRAKLEVQKFGRKYLHFAQALYRGLEEKYQDDPSVSVLLMSASDAARLRSAYPNYYLDASMFLDALARIGGGALPGLVRARKMTF